jgi:hypothetical protein
MWHIQQRHSMVGNETQKKVKSKQNKEQTRGNQIGKPQVQREGNRR